MALFHHQDIAVDSLVAAAFQSATSTSYLNLTPASKNIALQTWFGSLEGTPSLTGEVYHGIASSLGEWHLLFTIPNNVAASTTRFGFLGTSATGSVPPLLPCIRVDLRAENAGGTASRLDNISAKLLIECA